MAAHQIKTLAKSPISIVWLVLIIATLISWKVGSDAAVAPHLASAVVIFVAFFKVRFVGLYFMELRESPLPLRLIFEGYCIVVCATLVIMYLAAGGP